MKEVLVHRVLYPLYFGLFVCARGLSRWIQGPLLKPAVLWLEVLGIDVSGRMTIQELSLVVGKDGRTDNKHYKISKSYSAEYYSTKV